MKEKGCRQRLSMYLAKEDATLQEASATRTHFSPEDVRRNFGPVHRRGMCFRSQVFVTIRLEWTLSRDVVARCGKKCTDTSSARAWRHWD